MLQGTTFLVKVYFAVRRTSDFWVKTDCCLQDLEEEADRLQANIESGHKDKSQLLTDIVDTEKQVSFCFCPML